MEKTKKKRDVLLISTIIAGVAACAITGYTIYNRVLDANALVGSTPTPKSTTISATYNSIPIIISNVNNSSSLVFVDATVLDRMNAYELANWEYEHFEKPGVAYDLIVKNEFDKYLATRLQESKEFAADYSMYSNFAVGVTPSVPSTIDTFEFIPSQVEDLNVEELAEWYRLNILPNPESREQLFNHWLTESKDEEFILAFYSALEGSASPEMPNASSEATNAPSAATNVPSEVTNI